MQIAIPLASFLVSFGLSLVLMSARQGDTALAKRLLELQREPSGNDQTGPRKQSDERAKSSRITRLKAELAQIGAHAGLVSLIEQSGVSVSVSSLVGRSVTFGCIGGVLAVAAFHTGGLDLAFLALGCWLPVFRLFYKRKRRLAQIEASLPDAVDLMARSLRAGHSLGAAFEILAERCPGPLGAEFARVAQQQRLGVVFRDSVLELSSRIPSRDLRLVVIGILVQRETGGDLIEMLLNIRSVIAARVRTANQMKTHSAQGRFTGWVLGALPMVLLLVMHFVNPGYSGVLWHDPRGKKLLAASCVCVATGLATIQRMVRIRV